MNCAIHTETEATGYCRACGKPLCSACQHTAQGTLFCAEHAPAPSAAAEAATGGTARPGPAGPGTAPPPPRAQEWSPYNAPAPPPPLPEGAPSPGLAFILGLIPGVGAIYNSQYVKGLVHVVIFAMIISILSSDAAPGFEVLFSLMIPAWIIYQAFEAYHTAKRRLYGYSVDEFSGLVPAGRKRGFPAGPVLLIAIGVLFLLNTMDLLRISQIARYWPLLLIALGAYLLYERLVPAAAANGSEERR
ncbi:MAG: B-box zinc finger protein [Bryobacteraceae bacterium]